MVFRDYAMSVFFSRSGRGVARHVAPFVPLSRETQMARESDCEQSLASPEEPWPVRQFPVRSDTLEDTSRRFPSP
jgi:hypothetical protein